MNDNRDPKCAACGSELHDTAYCHTAPSADSAPKAAQGEARCALSTGSLPVSSAEVIACAEGIEWTASMIEGDARQYDLHRPDAPHLATETRRTAEVERYCASILRRHAASMNPRQPEENK